MEVLKTTTGLVLLTGLGALMCFVMHIHRADFMAVQHLKISQTTLDLLGYQGAAVNDVEKPSSTLPKPPTVCNAYNTCNSLSMEKNDFNEDLNNTNEKPLLILLYPPKRSHYMVFDNSSEINRKCIFTFNASNLREADFVVFHLNDLPGRFPPRLPWQRWVLHSNEPPYKMRNSRLKSAARFSGRFNLTSQYSYHSDIPTPYFYCRVARSGDEKLNKTPEVPQKTGMVSWAVSHCKAPSQRHVYASHLSKYVSVHIYGKCSSVKKSNNTFDDIMKNYRFYLAFENSVCFDYISEKLFKVLASYDSYVIPIVLGAGPYDNFVPAGSYINVQDFDSPQALANHLHYLDQNESAFMEYFTWRDHYTCVPKTEPYKTEKRCEAFHAVAHVKQVLSKAMLEKVFDQKDNCISAEEYYAKLGISLTTTSTT